jgi:putative mycofactocin binding protein MftB
VSTEFDPQAAWRLHPQVSVRPERYHFGTRRLSFLKSPTLLTVVTGLADAPSAAEACRTAGVPADKLPSYTSALATLAASSMICERGEL